jgi:filamentous hemagglutinin family protein
MIAQSKRPQTRRVATVPMRKVIAVMVAASYGGAHASPVNPTVVAGQASFAVQGKTYSITNTPNTIINWQGFSIGADEITRFIQQSADSKVLNRITGQDPSHILGSLQSNGKVFLINPNGVMFGAGSRVDVNGLVASSLAISNADFLAGKNNFTDVANAGKVSNAGTITTPSGGQIFLVAPAVENSGIISAANGDVVLAAGHSVQLFDSKDPNVQVVVSSPSDQALNLGAIVAQGGRVGVYGALVSQRGTINANSAVRGERGQIILKSSRTTLLEAGSVTSAQGAGEGANLSTGGDIQLLGPQVGLTGNAVVDASGAAGGGTVLVGGDFQGKNAAVPNAQQSYIGQDSVIKADATGLGAGNGGKVIVWSDRATQMLGNISARGGAAGGNGGFVETSGHYLDMRGAVDTRAPAGKIGTLLLDPSDVYIASSSTAAEGAGMLCCNNIDNPSTAYSSTTPLCAIR